MKIPFDIKFKPQIESGEYKVVIEYDNRTFYARIVCWDFNSTELLVCVNYGDREDVLEYDSSGKHIGKSVGRPDLIIITPGPELTKFEKRLFEIRHIAKRDMYSDEEWQTLRGEAAGLLELAKDEIYSHESLVEYAKMAKAEGKAEALKNLPRWKKAAVSFGNHSVAQTETGQLCLLIDGYYIMLSDLKKLPGFND